MFLELVISSGDGGTSGAGGRGDASDTTSTVAPPLVTLEDARRTTSRASELYRSRRMKEEANDNNAPTMTTTTTYTHTTTATPRFTACAIASSMSDCSGLRSLHSFLSVPYLRRREIDLNRRAREAGRRTTVWASAVETAADEEMDAISSAAAVLAARRRRGRGDVPPPSRSGADGEEVRDVDREWRRERGRVRFDSRRRRRRMRTATLARAGFGGRYEEEETYHNPREITLIQ